ncbi:hypothetical protein JCM15457_91 [Liquorilactobacillus sucicola DSM 21376 = JCM 15457]|uniref:tRNA(Met) cytidine acetate ligase n=1 Tax=Liquorilactobacillus sucicola DSM 21376 = JCM 15457 TaxID=1423806 RepID=A0A023CUI9_9LACO|nr:nucleotidyltransferase [Liquorilactobacillus sucicola]KRN05183.1 hypothetical protein FD15_GL001727 [Liquorilactobacillus sucicola DSM 21376 = JCM 15457]GAJ25236.1 hypothetical protein JCM15457_91 [Liquorilactobacillus sucicola DSM 21376 = JCM 15457]
MTVVGIIAEYNPFHNGHLYQLEQARAKFPDATIVVAMSGNFLERGEPACVDKWTRARQAIIAGVDVIVELPLVFCVQPADRFALGAVKILKQLGVEKLFFGAEHATYDFNAMAQKTLDVHGDFSKYNESYAAAYQRVVQEKLGYSVDQPNDLLGLAYAKANLRVGSPFEMVPLQRVVAGHHDLTLKKTQRIASASAIRKQLVMHNETETRNYVPLATYETLSAQKIVSWANFWLLLRYQLETSSLGDIRRLYDVSAGLEYRMKQQLEPLAKDATFDDWIKAVKSKRYTYTRLARLAVTILVQVTNEDVRKIETNPYIRLLGFSSRGQLHLNKVKKNCSYPIIVKVDKKNKENLLCVDYRAGNVYALASGVSQDLKRAPIRFQ